MLFRIFNPNMRFLIRSILVGLVLLFSSGCVYFNTFYNAKKYFALAREQQIRRVAAGSDTTVLVTENEKKLFAKSMEKCSKVLDVYSKDREYVPRAIQLLGEIYYWQGDYIAAIRKFNEFISNNPEHPSIHRVYYYKGLSYLKQGDYPSAEQELEKVAVRAPSKTLRNRAAYMLAEIAMLRGSSFGALDQLKRLDGSSRAMQSLIRFKIGTLLYKQRDFEGAHKAFVKVEAIAQNRDMDELGMPDNMKYTADFNAGLCLKQLNRLVEARVHFSSLINNNAYFKRFGEIYNEVADCYFLMGNDTLAEEIYHKVVHDYDKSRAAATAYYRLGLMYEKRNDGLSNAFSYYRKAQSVAGQCEEALFAKERLQNLRLIRFLTADRETFFADSGFTRADTLLMDSIGKLSVSEKHFRIAETYLYLLDNVDSALHYYTVVSNMDSIIDSTDSCLPLKMKSHFARAWLLDNIIGKKEEAALIYQALIETYAGTEYARAAANTIGLKYEIRADSLRSSFLSAESLFYNVRDCAAAYRAFFKIATNYYTDSLWAAKALLAAGWCADECLSDSSLAIAAYSLLDSLYSKTPHAEFARKKLYGRKEKLIGEFAVQKPGTTLNAKDNELLRRADSLSGGKSVAEMEDEEAWVKIDAIVSTGVTLEGKRTETELKLALVPAINALDEIYINMVDEGLKQEGVLSAVVTIKSSGEIGRIRFEKGGINDQPLLVQVESLLAATQFVESPFDVTVTIKIRFKNNAGNNK